MGHREPVALTEGPHSLRTSAPQAPVPDAFIDALVAELGAESVSADDEVRATWGRDWWPRAAMWAVHGVVPARPAVVVRPLDASQIATTIRLAVSHNVPVTPAAGRSGVCGGSAPVVGGAVLDLTALDRVLDVDDVSLWALVQTGVFGVDFESALSTSGHTLGHWPQSIEISTVGGWLACRSAGQYSTRYGKIEDMVVALEVVDGTGSILRAGGSPRASVGPDLTQLFLGSEGTLGIITEAVLRVHPTPIAEQRCAYGFESFADGLDACRRILRRGATPAVVRLYDEMESQRSYGQATNLLLLLDEGDPEIVEASMEVARQECGNTPGVSNLDGELVALWLEHRNDTSALGTAVTGGLVVDTIEIAANWSTLPRLYSEVLGALREIKGTIAASAHCSHSYTDGGCLYFTFAGHVGDDLETKDRYYCTAFAAAMHATMAAGGAISHHHGIGLNRAPYMARALGEEAMRVLAGIKQVLDPSGILNPGVLGLPSPFLTDGPSSLFPYSDHG